MPKKDAKHYQADVVEGQTNLAYVDSSKNLEEQGGTSRETVIDTDAHQPETPKDPQLWRDLTSYWILGLCNNYGYVVMLSAAHDIIEQFNHGGSENPGFEHKEGSRDCNLISTGAILLADIIPALLVKGLAPFIPFWVNTRVLLSILLAASGFLLVAFAESEWMALAGVVCTSASSGIGETSFLAYSGKFNKNVISTWSSGTGGAGIIGSVSYAGLRSLDISPRNTMLIMLIFPAIEAAAFWILLRKPAESVPMFDENSLEVDLIDEKPLVGWREKLYFIKTLLKYMIPLTTVYLFEYFINQGLFELVYFDNSILDKAAQYRWLNVDYQIGVFISRSSVNLLSINKIWLMSIFQLINVAYFLTEVIFYYTPSIWIVFAIVLWEGLLGGGAYVNTFYKMSKEISPARQQFAMGIVAQSDSFGITLAGFLAMPIHNAICKLDMPTRG